jgi:hypothetical protein
MATGCTDWGDPTSLAAGGKEGTGPDGVRERSTRGGGGGDFERKERNFVHTIFTLLEEGYVRSLLYGLEFFCGSVSSRSFHVGESARFLLRRRLPDRHCRSRSHSRGASPTAGQSLRVTSRDR